MKTKTKKYVIVDKETGEPIYFSYDTLQEAVDIAKHGELIALVNCTPVGTIVIKETKPLVKEKITKKKKNAKSKV